MAKCKRCNGPIEWRTHPQNPNKMAPFNADGTIHFSTCSAKKDDQRRYDSIDEIEQICSCGRKAEFVHYQRISNGRLIIAASCSCGRKITTLPHNEENKKLINARLRKPTFQPPYYEESDVWGISVNDYESYEELIDPFKSVDNLGYYNSVIYSDYAERR